MATRKSMWILFGILIIAAWILGSVIQAGAQTYIVKWRTTGHYPKMHIIEVGDVPGHIVFVGEHAGVLSCDDGSVETYAAKFMGELIKGSGKSQGYNLTTYEDGSTQWIKFQQTVKPDPDGKIGTLFLRAWLLAMVASLPVPVEAQPNDPSEVDAVASATHIPLEWQRISGDWEIR